MARLAKNEQKWHRVTIKDPRGELMPDMCTCAGHCTRSSYHERACCDQPPGDCWCHKFQWTQPPAHSMLGDKSNYPQRRGASNKP